VGPDRLTLLARAAETADMIDVDRAETARRRAEQRLAEHQADTDMDRARFALSRALVRLQAKRGD